MEDESEEREHCVRAVEKSAACGGCMKLTKKENDQQTTKDARMLWVCQGCITRSQRLLTFVWVFGKGLLERGVEVEEVGIRGGTVRRVELQLKFEFEFEFKMFLNLNLNFEGGCSLLLIIL